MASELIVKVTCAAIALIVLLRTVSSECSGHTCRKIYEHRCVRLIVEVLNWDQRHETRPVSIDDGKVVRSWQWESSVSDVGAGNNQVFLAEISVQLEFKFSLHRSCEVITNGCSEGLPEHCAEHYIR